jgi:hypothetical protein
MMVPASDLGLAPEVPAALVLRVRSEFVEMPGLRLTAGQAARLWGLERTLSERVLISLEASGFLVRTRDGAFVRRALR